nr:sigma-E factor regulatory protein RseB domain-containing protein [Deinobacterium chartae]
MPFSPQLMRRNFDLAVTQDDTVAGRQAVRYDLTPRQGSAARWTFWVDAEYELPLAFEERAADGTLLRRATYLSLEGKPRRRAKPLPQRVFTLRGPLEGAARQALPGLQLPPGFRVVDLQRGRRAGVDTLELLLSDGLNVVPVVLTSRAVRGGPGVRARQFGGNWVWVVGNLPDHTLEAMLKNLHGPLDPQSLGTFLNRADSNP